MITAITTTATVIIMFLFLSGPSNIAIALSLSEVLHRTLIEATIRGQTAEARKSVRRSQLLPLIAAMKAWLEVELNRLPPRGGVADAIRYALTRWTALCRFLDDGRVELDNNTVERAIRPQEPSVRRLRWRGGTLGDRRLIAGDSEAQ